MPLYTIICSFFLQELEAKKKAEAEEKAKKEEEEKAKKTKTKVVTTTNVDDSILEPFSYFDKPSGHGGQQLGNLKRETVEGILHAMGMFYLPFQEAELWNCFTAEFFPRFTQPVAILA